jgi:hypothetical protein
MRALGAAYEGAFASRVLGQNLETLAPFASSLAGSGSWRSPLGGLLQGRFGFGDYPTGLVYNAPIGPVYDLGVIIPLESTNNANGNVVGGPARFGGPWARWTWETWDKTAKAWRLRAGLMVTLMPQGNFFLKFAGGANYGDTVYASLVDGTAVSGSGVANTIATAFTVCGNVAPGRLAVVSSTAKFS